jgi:hypothetical protein
MAETEDGTVSPQEEPDISVTQDGALVHLSLTVLLADISACEVFDILVDPENHRYLKHVKVSK